MAGCWVDGEGAGEPDAMESESVRFEDGAGCCWSCNDGAAAGGLDAATTVAAAAAVLDPLFWRGGMARGRRGTRKGEGRACWLR